MAVNEALPTVVNEPAVDIGAVLLVVPVVLLPAPDAHKTRTDSSNRKFGCLHRVFMDPDVPGDKQLVALHLHGGLFL